MTILVIVESPTKCEKIENYLGENYKVVASCGHITSFSSLEQFDKESYDIKYKIEKPKILSMLKKEIKKCDSVIIATDDDREGEAIGWHICKQCKLDINKTPRILFSEITKEAILKALQNPTKLNMQRIYSQQTRQLLDLYIGFTISPLLWKYILNKLSAGRCQTPALYMLYEKEKEIENKNMETHFKVSGLFTSHNILFNLSQYLKLEQCKSFLELCKEYDFKIDDIEKKQIKENRPDILITNTLQQKAHQCLNMSPKQTMNYAQILYENGLITYMRSDSPNYNESFQKELKYFIEKKYGKEYVKPIVNKDKKAHEGIRVTNLHTSNVSFENNYINKLYDLIYIHTLQTGMENCDKLKKIFKMKAPMNYEFSYIEDSIIFYGWRKALKEKIEHSDELYLSQLKKINYNNIQCEEQLCEPKYHYCESQIIQKLKKENIGRPSTYSSILDKIQEKNYVKKGNIKHEPIQIQSFILKEKNIEHKSNKDYIYEEKNKLYITETGKKVIKFCYKYYEHLFNYTYTSKMESILDQIEYEEKDWKPIFKLFKEEVDKEVSIEEIKAKQESLHCGKYKNKVIIIKKGQFGYYIEYAKKKTSLLQWEYYDNIDEYIKNNCFPEDKIETLIQFCSTIHINENISIRKSKHGEYIYYKTKTMRKPKFYPLNIESRNIEDIKNYIEKNYKSIL